MDIAKWKGIVFAGLLAGATALGCGGDGGNGTPPEPFDLFGGKAPTEAELASYPKALPPDALAVAPTDGAGNGQTPTRHEIADERLPPVQAQGTPEQAGYPGSCEVWSAGYAMGSFTANLTNRKDIKDLDNTVSAAFVYMRVLSDEAKSCGEGTSPAGTLNYLVHNTAPSLQSVPYEPVCECPEGSDQCLDAIDVDASCDTDPSFCTDLSIGSWAALAAAPPADILATIRGYVAQDRIVQITIVVPYEFGDYSGGVYDAPTACPSPQPSNCAPYRGIACIASTKEPSGCAQHGVAIVGYDDEKRDPSTGTPGALKIMNSFGKGWGERGFMWMAYSTFEAIYLGATTALPPPAAAAADGPTQTATSAFQWVEPRSGAAPTVHLVFSTTLPVPLDVGEIAITAPDGRTVRHTYGQAFRSGFHYVSRHDGRQFEPGVYRVELEGATRDGVLVRRTDEVPVDPLEDGSLPSAPFGDDLTGTNGQPVR